MLLDQILLNADEYRAVLNTTVNNTISTPWSFEDWNAGGCIANAGHIQDVAYITNAALSISNGDVPGKSVSKLMTSELSVTRSVPEPFSGQGGATNFTSISISSHESTDDIINRDFEDARVELKVGGKLLKNKPGETELVYDEYATWFEGEIVGYARDVDTTDLQIGLKSDAQVALYPPNQYLEGESKGLPIPVALGRAYGIRPDPVSEGLWRFHDGSLGLVDTTDTTIDFKPASFIGYGRDYYNSISTDFEGDPLNLGPVRDVSDFTWIQNGDTEADSNTDIITNVKVTGTGSELVVAADAETLTVKKGPDAPTDTYDGLGFRWARISPTKIESITQPKIVVETTGDIEIVLLGGEVPNRSGQWFKINTNTANGAGTVTFTFPEKLRNAEMFTRGVRGPIQTISNWSKEPQSITPPYEDSNVVYNHLVNLRDVDSKTLSFDYTDDSTDNLSAIWFGKIRLGDPVLTDVSIDFEDVIVNPVISFSQPEGADTIYDSILPLSASSGLKAFQQRTFTGNAKTLNFKVDLARGPISFKMHTIQPNLESYGAYKNGDLYELRPPPVFTPGFPPGDFAGEAHLNVLYPFGVPVGMKSRMRVKIRMSEGPNGGVLAVFTAIGANPSVRRIDTDWRIIEMPVSNTTQFSIDTFRGTIGHPLDAVTSNITNPDVDTTLQIEFFEILPVQPQKPDLVFYVIENGVKERLPTYRVDNTRLQRNVPEGVAIYDDTGLVSAFTEYTELIGDVVGYDRDLDSVQMLKDIAFMASGVNFVEANFTGHRVSTYAKNRLPAAAYLSKLCSDMDYLYREDLVGGTFTISPRYDYLSHPGDFVIDNGVITNSVERLDSEERRYQYIVTYRKDHSDPLLSKRIESRIGNYLNKEPIYIDSPFFDEGPNQALADRIIRDSERNDVIDFSIDGIGHGIREGDAGVVFTDGVPANKATIVKSITEEIAANSEVATTRLTVKVLKGRGAFNG